MEHGHDILSQNYALFQSSCHPLLRLSVQQQYTVSYMTRETSWLLLHTPIHKNQVSLAADYRKVQVACVNLEVKGSK